MTARQYIFRSLVYHRFAYLGVFGGAILGATVLLGALFAGDSVKASLQRIAEQRIGRTTHLISAGDRFFRQALADEFATAANVRAAAVIYARGVATHAGTQAAVNRVQLVGVTPAFWRFAPTPLTVELAGDQVAINTTLAQRLGLSRGDTLIVRVQKPGILAGNAPIAGAESKLESVRCTVAAVVDENGFGRFTLETTQVAQPTVFLPIATLQESLERKERANLLLIEAAPDAIARLRPTLERTLQLADYGLALKWRPVARAFEVSSERIFIDPEADQAISRAVPAEPVLSYLVNELRIGERATPYSIASATTARAAPFLPADLGPREAVLNRWLADDLNAQIGDDLTIAYYQIDAAGALVERSAKFRVRDIVALEGLAADSAWMPEFPGITDTRDQREWDPGLPLNLERIRDKDERYWDDHRGAPKAFLSPEGGRAIWSTRWGRTTGLRISMPLEREAELTSTLRSALRPEMNQLLLRELRSSANASASSPVDFGGLFIGMSFFLILAALGLVGMLFQFVLLQRNREDALLAAVGITPTRLRRWRMGEGLALLLLAAAFAVPLAALYSRGVLHFLETIWSDGAGGTTFTFDASPGSVAGGLLGFLLCSMIAIWFALRRLAKRALSIRLAAHTEDGTPLPRIRRRSAITATVAALVAIGALLSANRGIPAQGAFYLAGFALLGAGLALCRWWMGRDAAPPGGAPAASDLGLLNLKSRRSRSLTVVGLIATAVFMVLSVASFRKHVGGDWLQKRSGTGGFTFWIETTAPQNLSRDGRTQGFDFLDRQRSQLSEILPLRIGTGDNANCFNLNTTAQPQLLAVNAARLATRQAFAPKAPQRAGWSSLAERATANPETRGTPSLAGTNAIPALVDETTLLWALKRKVGDVLEYNDENGRAFQVQIVGTLPDSIFQGYAIVDEQRFLEKFPSHAGYTVFLADANNAATTDLSTLRRGLESATRDIGGRVELTREVLAAFHAIENTYIAIFNVLGSLGVLLGSLGLAIVIARNLRERRGEFAVMSAIGIPRAVLARVVFTEFSRLVLWGLAIGFGAALVAVLPNITAVPPVATIGLAAVLLCGIVLLNLSCGWMVFRWATRDLRPSMLQVA